MRPEIVKKTFARDLIVILFIALLSIALGLAVNKVRLEPLSLAYASPQERLDQAIRSMGSPTQPVHFLKTEVELEEVAQLSLHRSAIIIDARPAVFYRLSHIPSALSIPRDDFKGRFQAFQSILTKDKGQRIIVYCAGGDCNDSVMVARAFGELGFQNVQVFRGGWSKWHDTGMPTER